MTTQFLVTVEDANGNGAQSSLSTAAAATLIGPALTLTGALTPASVASTGAVTSSSPSAGLGYVVGAGGVIVQQTNKSTTVQLDTVTGKITMNAASLVAGTSVSFTLTNAQIVATDLVDCKHISGGTAGAYNITVFPGAGSAVVTLTNRTAGDLAEAVVLRFAIIRSSDS